MEGLPSNALFGWSFLKCASWGRSSEYVARKRTFHLQVVLYAQPRNGCDTYIISNKYQGRIQEFWLGGRGFFFSNAWGLEAALRPPVGSGQRPGGGSGGEALGIS